MAIDPNTVKVPRARWGGRWLATLTKFAAGNLGADGEWHELASYKKTTGYQVARELNLAATIPAGGFEFGVVDEVGGSTLVVRDLTAGAVSEE